MSSVVFHNNTVAINELWHASHISLIQRVCLELGSSDKAVELVDKILGPKQKIKAKKDPNQPKKSKSAFFFFCDEARPGIMDKQRKKNKKIIIGDVAKELGLLWKALKNKQRTKFDSLAATDKERYQNEMQNYQPL